MQMRKKERVLKAVEALEKLYPSAICSLEYSDAFELLIATRLSAQCTDKRVNMVTPDLFAEAKFKILLTIQAKCGIIGAEKK